MLAKGVSAQMGNKRTLSEAEKELIRERRRAELALSHPGAKFFIHAADVTDDYGEPLISIMLEEATSH
jgi:hypothetical protein